MSERPLENGHYQCPMSIYEVELLQDCYKNTKETLEFAQNLQYLSVLPEIRDKLLSAATRQGWIPVATTDSLIAALNKQHDKQILRSHIVLGTAIAGLMFVIVYLLTGEKLQWLMLGR